MPPKSLIPKDKDFPDATPEVHLWVRTESSQDAPTKYFGLCGYTGIVRLEVSLKFSSITCPDCRRKGHIGVFHGDSGGGG